MPSHPMARADMFTESPAAIRTQAALIVNPKEIQYAAVPTANVVKQETTCTKASGVAMSKTVDVQNHTSPPEPTRPGSVRVKRGTHNPCINCVVQNQGVRAGSTSSNS